MGSGTKQALISVICLAAPGTSQIISVVDPSHQDFHPSWPFYRPGLQRSLPEGDTLNFLLRVKQPVLMLNGRYDFFCPVESSQQPFFRLLGSRSDQKKHLLYDTSHNLPRNEFIKEALYWLDQYLGPVQ